MTTTAQIAKLDELLGGDLAGLLNQTFTQMEWAEDEIEKARKRHRAHSDRIYHSFKLLAPTNERMGTEFVYRAHCAELLNRVAAGQDTRPGTDAEVCIACAAASLVAPLTETAAGLYARMWLRAFPQHTQVWGEQAPHYEALRGTLIDDAERDARRTLAVADRKLGETDAAECHDGDEDELHLRQGSGTCSA